MSKIELYEINQQHKYNLASISAFFWGILGDQQTLKSHEACLSHYQFVQRTEGPELYGCQHQSYYYLFTQTNKWPMVTISTAVQLGLIWFTC